MTITDNNQQATGKPVFNQPAAQAPHQEPKPFSFTNASPFAAFGGRNQTGEVLSRTVQAFTEALKGRPDVPANIDIKLIGVDNKTTTGLYYSTILLTVRPVGNVTAAVFYHAFLLEGSGEPIRPSIETFNGQGVEITKTPSDAYDAAFVKIVTAVLNTNFPSCNKFVNCDAEIVYKSLLNLEDKAAVWKQLYNGIAACIGLMTVSKDTFQDLNLNYLDLGNSRLSSSIQFTDVPLLDYAEHPVRNDIQIELSTVPAARQVNSASRSLNDAGSQSVKLVTLAGYIEFIYSPVAQQQQGPYGPPAVQAPPYSARFVMTAAENLAYPTTAGALLAIIASQSLNVNYAWLPNFRPRILAGKNTVDKKAVGALNIEANYFNDQAEGQRSYGQAKPFAKFIDFASGKSTDNEVFSFIAGVVRPELSFSMDISECGADTWINAVFLAAADGKQGAINEILKAAVMLTNGNFTKYYPTGENPIIQDMERIHLGYYHNEKGELRDRRDIDYLALMNLRGKVEPRVGADYANTYFLTDTPPDVRLSERKKLDEHAGVDITYSGYARRITVKAAFIYALVMGAKDCSLNITTISQTTGANMFNNRAVPSFLSQSAVNPNQGGVFNNNVFGGGSSYSTGYSGRTW